MAKLKDEERLHDNAVASEPSVSATPSPSPPLMLPLDPPVDVARPRAVRRLPLDHRQATDSPPQRSPSPVVYCSQYRMEEYKLQNGSMPGNEKVGDWLRANGPSPYPSPPAAPPKDQYVSDSEREDERPRRRRRQSQPLTLIKDGELYVHKDYTGRLPLCCYVTGLQEGGQHDYYPCYTENDIIWARRVKFHNERPRS